MVTSYLGLPCLPRALSIPPLLNEVGSRRWPQARTQPAIHNSPFTIQHFSATPLTNLAYVRLFVKRHRVRSHRGLDSAAPAELAGACRVYNYYMGALNVSERSCSAAGNQTEDPSNLSAHTYQWDAEGRVASVDGGSTWSFTYNALGHRVKWASPSGGELHLFDPEGNWLGNANS